MQNNTYLTDFLFNVKYRYSKQNARFIIITCTYVVFEGHFAYA